MSEHVFSDDYECYVAETLEQAMGMQRRLCGENPGEEDDWAQCADDEAILIWLDDEGEIAEHGMGVIVIGTCGVWAEAYGSGLLCSTEC